MSSSRAFARVTRSQTKRQRCGAEKAVQKILSHASLAISAAKSMEPSLKKAEMARRLGELDPKTDEDTEAHLVVMIKEADVYRRMEESKRMMIERGLR